MPVAMTFLHSFFIVALWVVSVLAFVGSISALLVFGADALDDEELVKGFVLWAGALFMVILAIALIVWVVGNLPTAPN